MKTKKVEAKVRVTAAFIFEASEYRKLLRVLKRENTTINGLANRLVFKKIA